MNGNAVNIMISIIFNKDLNIVKGCIADNKPNESTETLTG